MYTYPKRVQGDDLQKVRKCTASECLYHRRFLDLNTVKQDGTGYKTSKYQGFT